MLLINFERNNIKFNIYSDPCTWCFFDHDSTLGCLDTLYQIDCKDKEILDIGCGSGILDIYASKLGAKVVDATDIDPSAIGLTLINCQLNGVKVNLSLAKREINKYYDIIIMNIPRHNVIEYLEEVEKHLKFNGKAIITFPDRLSLENELRRTCSNLVIIEENNLHDYKTFILGVDK